MAGPHRSIATLISVSVVITSTTVLLAFAALFVWQEYQRAQQQLRLDTEAMSSQLAIALESPAWNFDRAQVEGLLDSAMQNSSVAAVVVMLEGGNSVYARTRDASWHSVPAAAAPAPNGGLLPVSRQIRIAMPSRGLPAEASGQPLGTVTVYATLQFLQQRLKDTLLTTIAAILVSDLLMVATLYLVMRSVALLPLRSLRAHAAAVAAGADEVAGLNDSRFRGEFEQLRESLATMLGLLKSRFKALGEEQRRYRHLMSEILRLQDAERRHIGRELHDSTGQSLAALEINLSLLQRSRAGTDASSQRLLDESEAIARQCLAAIRTTSYLLHPPLLDELGLATALRWLADGFRKRSDIQLHLVVADGVQRLPADVELVLFRVAQEALTNVYRHSGTRSAEMRLSRDAETVTLYVADSGKGFGPLAPGAAVDGSDERFGVGLTGMRERLREIGGQLTIRSDSGGTSIRATLPLLPG